jgi:hypothetical protein
MVILQAMPASRPTSLAGDDVRLGMDMYIIDAASTQSACRLAGSFSCAVGCGGTIIVSEGVLLLS